MVDPSDPHEDSPDDEVPTAVPIDEEDETKPTDVEAVTEPLVDAPADTDTPTAGTTTEEAEPEADEKDAATAEEESKVDSPSSDEKKEPEDGGMWEYAEYDVLCGRGAKVNSRPGNKKFRAACFVRKAEFEAGNHAAKRRVATEIVNSTVEKYNSRFLKRKEDKGPWYEMTKEQAILKACQVMRDYKRPDRLAQRELMAASGKKRNRATSTPLDDITPPPAPAAPLVENPYGVHDHDVLCGRGAFVNGHVGNNRLRTLASERKIQFDAGNYTEKRGLATEIVSQIRGLTPPGRFLRRVTAKAAASSAIEIEWAIPPVGDEAGWEELTDEKAIHKACQVMRDIDRPDRKERDERRRLKKLKKDGKSVEGEIKAGEDAIVATEMVGVAEEAGATSQTVEEAVAAAEEAMDKALGAAHSSSASEPVDEKEHVPVEEATV